MSQRKPGIPGVPSGLDLELAQFLERVRERLSYEDGLARREILIGTRQEIPQAGQAERFFYARDARALFYDDGKAWQPLITGEQRLFLIADADTVLDAAIPWNTIEVHDTRVFGIAGGGTEVTIKAAGRYRIEAEIATFISNTSTARSTSTAFLERNGAELNGARTYMYNRTASNDYGAGSITYVADLAKGDAIRLYAARNSGSAEISADADATRLHLECIG